MTSVASDHAEWPATDCSSEEKPGPVGPGFSDAGVGAGNSSRGEHAVNRRFWEDTSGQQRARSMRRVRYCSNAGGRMTAMRNRNSLRC
jgi:hypothetical protein